MLPAFFQDVLTRQTASPLTKTVKEDIQIDDIKNVVFFLVDGFGSKQWQDHRKSTPALQRFERDGRVESIDSVFPSCTPNALNTFHSNGLAPAQHGLIDWWLYIERLDKIIATLPFAEMGSEEKDSVLKLGADESLLLDNKTTYEVMQEKGILPRLFTSERYAHRAHTKVTAKGSELVTYTDAANLFSVLMDTLKKSGSTPTYNFVYWGKIDAAGHEYGLDSDEYRQAVNDYFGELENFLARTNEIDKTLFVMSADHGQINVNADETIYLDAIPGLSDLLKTSQNNKQILPWGGAREVFLSVKEGQLAAAIELLDSTIGDSVEIIRSEDALSRGLFGTAAVIHPDFISRIGDIIILPKEDKTVWYHHPGEDPLERKGDHGGLTNAEMKVPFALLRSR